MVEPRIVLPPEEGLAAWDQYDRHAWTAFDQALQARDGDDPDAPPLPTIRQLRRLACDARLAVVAHDHDGKRLVSASGTTPRIPARPRRMLHARDEGCRFPSCSAGGGLAAHHLVHWSDPGNTELPNLVLLCRHRFVHHHGWEILTDGHGHFRSQPPDDDPRPTVVDPPEVDPLAVIAGRDAFEFEPRGWPGPLAPSWDGTRPDYDACVGTLLEHSTASDPHGPTPRRLTVIADRPRPR